MAKKNIVEKVDKEENVKEEEKNMIANDYEEITLEERIINIEKKANASFWMNIVLIILVVFTLIFSVGGGTNNTETPSTNEDTEYEETVSYDTSAFKTITPADIEKESKGKSIVLWIGRQSCGYCSMYAPYIAEAAENYSITAYYIDLATMVEFNTTQPYITDSEAFNTLSSLTGSGDWKTFAADNMGATPLTLIIKNNKVIGGLSGAGSTENIESAFKTAGLKKK